MNNREIFKPMGLSNFVLYENTENPEIVIHLAFKAKLLGYYLKITISGHILSVYLAPRITTECPNQCQDSVLNEATFGQVYENRFHLSLSYYKCTSFLQIYRTTSGAGNDTLKRPRVVNAAWMGYAEVV